MADQKLTLSGFVYEVVRAGPAFFWKPITDQTDETIRACYENGSTPRETMTRLIEQRTTRQE